MMKNYICINGNKMALTNEQLEKLGFSHNGRTVAEIVEIMRRGEGRDHFHIHDVFNLYGYDLEVIGIDHDHNVDVPTRPTITLMAKTLLPARRMHPGTCQNGWIDTELRDWLQTDFFKQLPEELTQYICNVEKITHNSKGVLFETADTLFLPSESELFGSAIWSAREDGPRYGAFATSDDRIRVDEDGDGCWYWTRSAPGGYSTNFAYVNGHGTATSNSASSAAIRAPLCFCLA